MKTVYRLSSTKLKGHFLVSFEQGRLTGFEMAFKNGITDYLYDRFLSALPILEEFIGRYESMGLKVERVAAPNEKIAIFCRIYEQHVGIKYKVIGADAGKIKHVQLDEALLHHYFRSDNFLWKGKYSISNLVRYYNELRAEMATGGRQKHPDEWDASYCTKLKADQLSDYYRHLRSRGLRAIKDQTGRIIDWK
ncbi:hypothetical protein [Cecembia rubra]|nr:hypothetical protein [Cecembia rubra]